MWAREVSVMCDIKIVMHGCTGSGGSYRERKKSKIKK